MVVKKNTRVFEGMSASAAVSQYYEELRDYALGYRTALMLPLGIDLFMKRGMLAWIAAWTEFQTHRLSVFPPVKTAVGNIEAAIPQAMQHEITVLLARMILSRGCVS